MGEISTVCIDNSATIMTWRDMIGALVVIDAIMTIWKLKYHRRKSDNPQLLASLHENKREKH